MSNRQLLTIPVFNEEESLRPVVREALEHMDGSLADLLLINDGSSDASPRIIDELVAAHPNVQAVHQSENRGYGASMIEAMRFARRGDFDYVITMDCDRQHRPEDLRRFVEFDPKIDVVSGSRYMDSSGTTGRAPEDRVAINARITARLNRLYGWNLTDSFCGFKRYRTASLEFERFAETGYAFPLEFWAYCNYRELSIREIPVRRIYTTDDRSFGEDLDRKRKRYKYYLKTLSRAERKFRG